MPWLDKTAAMIEAWYPGARGGDAIPSVMFGETSPSGRLPVTFAAGVEQVPRARVGGLAEYEPNFIGGIPDALRGLNEMHGLGTLSAPRGTMGYGEPVL